jgi:hypothetical protein
MPTFEHANEAPLHHSPVRRSRKVSASHKAQVVSYPASCGFTQHVMRVSAGPYSVSWLRWLTRTPRRQTGGVCQHDASVPT